MTSTTKTTLKIAVLPGDGIGAEVIEQTLLVLRKLAEVRGLDLSFHEALIGGAAIKATGAPLPQATLDACLQSDAVLLGAVGSPEFDALTPSSRPEAGLLALRKALGGFANLRPIKCYLPITDCSPLRSDIIEGADMLIVRELLGGLYFSEPRGRDGDDDSAYNTMRYTTSEVERVSRIAFEASLTRRSIVASVDKANVLETSQLWRETVNRVAVDYPTVKLEHLYVDACAMHLMMNPSRFDVVLTENLFGDILSDEAAVISGSLGMLASATVGGNVDLYEPVHGSAPDIAGQGLANPLGAISSAAMLLRYSANLEQEADDIEAAITVVLEQGNRTPDLKDNSGHYNCGTSEMGSKVVAALSDITERRHGGHAG
jgi:3-isopropylmalate dehydrogenase